MTEGLKDRPAQLRRLPRPAPDEKVDPVDYSPAAVAPAAQATAPVAAAAQSPMTAPAEPPPAGGGVESPAVVAPAQSPVEPAAQVQTLAAPVVPAPTATRTRQTPKTSKASKPPTSRKSARREVTFPLSTRISEEVSDILYAAAEDEDISVREAIEQAIKARWGQN